ncbi:MAG: dienelactone hydrolase family protein [Anaerolineae bacterium]
MQAPDSSKDESALAHIQAGPVSLEGNLVIPPGAHAVVLFAHGSGSSRHSPRNQYVARFLRAGGLATLLIDLLTEREEAVDSHTRGLRFDIPFLAARLSTTIDWLTQQPETQHWPIGLFGASTGAAAALVAAAQRPDVVAAVVSRGGRPDLAGEALAYVRAPTLLIVGGYDIPVIPLNEAAFQALRCEKRLDIVPEATHLFEEPGALEEVARLARGWFIDHLSSPRHDGRSGAV